MPSNSDPGSLNDGFRKVEAKLGSIQAIAKKISETPESRLKRTLNPAAFAARQGDFNIAVVEGLKEVLTGLREAITSHENRLEQLEQNVAETRSLSTELRERSTAAETQLTQMRQEQGELRERSAATGTQLAELVEKLSQVSAGQGDLSSELRERIQHLLDEQRVCLRQLSLKTSEEAVLAERTRRATELRLEELARRLPERPA